MKNPLILLASIALASCAAPKAVVVAEAPKTKRPAAPAETPIALADDGMRLPENLLALPEDNQLRSSAPINKDGGGTIITSPPTE